MPSYYRSRLRRTVRRLVKSLRGPYRAVMQYLTESPDALPEVCAAEMVHDVRRPIRRKPRIVAPHEARYRLYQMETQRELGVGVCDAA